MGPDTSVRDGAATERPSRRGHSRFTNYAEMLRAGGAPLNDDSSDSNDTENSSQATRNSKKARSKETPPTSNSIDNNDNDNNDDDDDDDDDYEDATPYCFCRRPDDGTFMIECEKCNEWYHGACVRISEAKAKTISAFLCENCRPGGSGYKNATAFASTTKQATATKTSKAPIAPKKPTPSTKSTKNSSALAVATSGVKRKTSVLSVDSRRSSANSLDRKPSAKPRSSSSSAPQSASNPDSQLPNIRVNARKSLAEVLGKVLEAAQRDPQTYAGIDPTVETPFWSMTATDAAIKLETEMYDQLAETVAGSTVKICGEAYKVKYRQLRFNFSDNKNDSLRLRLLKGEISISSLVAMSAEELANEEVAKKLEEIRTQSLLGVLKGDYAKEQLEKRERGELTDRDVLSELVSKANEETAKRKPVEEEGDLEAKTKRLFMKEATISPTVRDLDIRRTSLEQSKSNTEIDSRLAPPIPDEDMLHYDASDVDEAGTAISDAEHELELEVDNTPTGLKLWSGSIFMTAFGTFGATAETLRVTPQNIDWKGILGEVAIEIAGKIEPHPVEKYIRECRDSKGLVAFAKITIDNSDAMWEYFFSKSRLAVTPLHAQHGLVRDAYMMPLKKGTPPMIRVQNKYIENGLLDNEDRVWLAILVFDHEPKMIPGDYKYEQYPEFSYVSNRDNNTSTDINNEKESDNEDVILYNDHRDKTPDYTAMSEVDESSYSVDDNRKGSPKKSTSQTESQFTSNSGISNSIIPEKPTTKPTSLLDMLNASNVRTTAEMVFSKSTQPPSSVAPIAAATVIGSQAAAAAGVGTNTLKPLVDMKSTLSNTSSVSTAPSNSALDILRQLAGSTAPQVAPQPAVSANQEALLKLMSIANASKPQNSQVSPVVSTPGLINNTADQTINLLSLLSNQVQAAQLQQVAQNHMQPSYHVNQGFQPGFSGSNPYNNGGQYGVNNGVGSGVGGVGIGNNYSQGPRVHPSRGGLVGDMGGNNIGQNGGGGGNGGNGHRGGGGHRGSGYRGGNRGGRRGRHHRG